MTSQPIGDARQDAGQLQPALSQRLPRHVHQRLGAGRHPRRTPGYGLGVVVADFNGDGWPDIYVSNDGPPNDVLYVNNGNGTFTNKRRARGSATRAPPGMGVDIADFNNDGWPDILQVDMLPHDLAPAQADERLP